MVVRMTRRRAAKWCARELAATVGDHLVHVHVELSAASSHPDMQRKHVLMAAGEDLITDLDDQLVVLFVEPLAGIVGIGGSFLQNGVRANHFARHEVLADAEVLKRALGLGAPELVSRNVDYAEAISFLANICHLVSPLVVGPRLRFPKIEVKELSFTRVSRTSGVDNAPK